MKMSLILGPALLVVLLFSGLAAAPASAMFRCAVTWTGEPASYERFGGGTCPVGTGTPKYYAKVEINALNFVSGQKECARVENSTLEGSSWSDFECMVGTGTHQYIWVSRHFSTAFIPSKAFPVAYTTTMKDTVLKGSGGEIKCGKGKGKGTVKAEITESAEISFSECSGKFNEKKCPAEMSTKPLTGTLGGVSTEESTTEVGILLTPEKTVFMELTCEGSTFTIEGSVAAEVTPVKKSGTEDSYIFTASGSGNKIKTIVGVPGEEKKPELKLSGKPLSLESTDNVVYKEAIEVT